MSLIEETGNVAYSRQYDSGLEFPNDSTLECNYRLGFVGEAWGVCETAKRSKTIEELQRSLARRENASYKDRGKASDKAFQAAVKRAGEKDSRPHYVELELSQARLLRGRHQSAATVAYGVSLLIERNKRVSLEDIRVLLNEWLEAAVLWSITVDANDRSAKILPPFLHEMSDRLAVTE